MRNLSELTVDTFLFVSGTVTEASGIRSFTFDNTIDEILIALLLTSKPKVSITLNIGDRICGNEGQ